MGPSKSRLSYLLDRYHGKTATEQESRELFLLLHRAGDEELTDFLRQEWEKIREEGGAEGKTPAEAEGKARAQDPGKIQAKTHAQGPSSAEAFFDPAQSAAILNRILQARTREAVLPRTGGKRKGKRKYVLLRRLAAAAAVLIFVSFGVYLLIKPAPEVRSTRISGQHIPHDALPGGNKATLTLSDGKTVILDNARNGVLAEQGNARVNKARDGQLIYEVAGGTAQTSIPFNTLSTPRGGQYQLVLPDGSKVWLNAASSLEFPAVFTGNERLVELKGEAYFEVAPDPSMPFKVRSGPAEVEVLGTHFNIMAYGDESVMRTTLLEGAVKIKSDRAVNILKPGEQAVLDRNGHMKVVGHADVSEAVAWKNGLFQFNDADLRTIMREAARWYDLDVSYHGQVPLQHFTGRISRNVKASELLSILKYTGVNFRIEGKKIIVIN